MKRSPVPRGDTTERLVQSVDALRRRMEKTAKRSIALSFLQGLAYGMGFFVAIALFSTFIVWAMQSVNWPPLIAEFLAKVLEQMEGKL